MFRDSQLSKNAPPMSSKITLSFSGPGTQLKRLRGDQKLATYHMPSQIRSPRGQQDSRPLLQSQAEEERNQELSNS